MKSLGSRIRNLPLAAGAAATAVALSTSVIAAEPQRVIFIHGIWDTLGSLRRLDTALRDAGFETLVVELQPNDGSVSLEKLAGQVHRDIEARFGSDAAFSIVGFSMGGLVARSYLRQYGKPGRVPAVVTIASPHGGTWLACFSALRGVREMRPGSPFLRALEDDHLRFHGTKWTTIRTPFDLMILPSNSSALPWARNIVVPAAAHPLLAFDRRVIRHTLEALGVSTTSASDAPASRRAGSLQRRIPGTPPLPKASREAQ